MAPPAPNWLRRRRLGRGSFAAVDLAAELPSGRLFAVKSVELQPASAAAVAVLEHEISFVKALSSPYIVEYIADDVTSEVSPAGDVRRCRNLHMEYLPGGTAAEAGAMEERRVRSVARRVALGLEYLHSTGIAHGDVKGRNVLLGPPAKLTDFGSAVSLSDNRPSTVRGTPLWMAPEIARGEPPSPAADIWSLACTVIEMLTGMAPVRGRAAEAATPIEAIFLISSSGDPPEIPKLLSEMGKDFLGKCFTVDPGRRWTAKELLHHPFLAGAEEAMIQWSPRSVLDTIISETTDYAIIIFTSIFIFIIQQQSYSKTQFTSRNHHPICKNQDKKIVLCS